MNLTSLERQEQSIFLEHNAYLDEGHGCWLSKGNKDKDGYGLFYFRGKLVRLHRLAYAVFVGDFYDNLCVLHKCDVPHCYYPEHLFLGTNADNMADKVAKGRQAKGEKHGMSLGGEKHGKAKLRGFQILKILIKSKTGLSHRKMAKEYGVCRSTISSVIRRATWKYIK